MSAIASWLRSHRLETAWAVFALANFAVLILLIDYQTVPFHFVWVSLTLLYGARVSAARRWGRGAQRDWRVEADLDGVLMADRERLDAVLDNAIRATRESDTIAIAAQATR